MSQISLPVRIILIGAVVFLAAWFTVLRPKPVTVEPATTPTITTSTEPATGPGKAVDAAKKAATTAAAAGQAAAGETAPATTDPATGAATTTTPETKPEAAVAVAIPADALAKLPTDVAAALEARKVLVLAVFGEEGTKLNPMADDDRYVRNNLRKVNRYDGDVFIKRITGDQLSTYGSLVNDLDVNQTPSVVVIDRNLKGNVLTGYVDRVAVNQAIADARRDSTSPDITDPYLRDANQLCTEYQTRLRRWSLPTIPGRKAETASYKRVLAITHAYRLQLARLATPAKWNGLQTAWLKGMKADEAIFAAFVTASASGKAADLTAAKKLNAKNDWSSMDRRFNEAGLTACATNRRS